MNRKLTVLALLLLAAASTPAQTLQEYLHLRRLYHIVQAVGEPALETLVGTRVFEVQGIVKGTFSTGSKAALLLERPDGGTQVVDAPSVPDWVVGSEIPARLLIKASRTDELDEVHATLIAVAREDDIQPVEAAAMAASGRTATRHKKGSSKSNSPNGFTVNGNAPQRTWIVPADKVMPYYAAYIKKDNPRLSDAEAERMANSILGFGKMYGVDARLIVAMVMCESDFNPKELSHAGAMGLGQLMPDTARDYGISDPYDSVQNLYGTVREIRSHLDKYRGQTGDDFQALVLGLAAYNAGEGAVKRHGGVPPYKETQNYVRRVINLYAKLSGYH